MHKGTERERTPCQKTIALWFPYTFHIPTGFAAQEISTFLAIQGDDRRLSEII